MKKFVLSVVMLLLTINISSAEQYSTKETADTIYNQCRNSISQIETNTNDIIQEQKLRLCLKSEIIRIAENFINKEELDILTNRIDEIEKTTTEIYRILIFCTPNNDTSWCKDSFRQESSLGQLILEKNITAQIYNILTAVLESKSGNFIF